jgi:hypothetical protein
MPSSMMGPSGAPGNSRAAIGAQSGADPSEDEKIPPGMPLGMGASASADQILRQKVGGKSDAAHGDHITRRRLEFADGP